MKLPNFYKLILSLSLLLDPSLAAAEASKIKIGWIGAMSGALAKYGSYQSALLAQEDINSLGGVNGVPIELIFEDGKGDGKTAASAAQKLINVDKVKYLIAGHCSPESLAIAPIAENAKVVMLAAITSNPKLTNSGDYIFRITAVSTTHADIEVPYAMDNLGLKSFAIVYEETDYALPPAERFTELVKAKSGRITSEFSYQPGETDFRTIATKIASQKPDAIYLGVQSPESAILFLKQLSTFRYKGKIFGNELTGNAVTTDLNSRNLFEGLIFGEPEFDIQKSPTKSFIEHYKKRFNTEGLPYGIWSAEAYDAPRLLASVIQTCGASVEEVKRCLYSTKDYDGVSGKISIDENGDGLRNYKLKRISDGLIKTID